jgi:menaquinol-cytochrome c reductase iron-sulfur subunit
MFRLLRRSDQLTSPGVGSPKRGRRRGGRGGWEQESLGLTGYETSPKADDSVSRRGFLSRALGWVTAGIAVAIAIPGGTEVVSAAFRKNSNEWNPIARLGESTDVDLSVVGKPQLTSFRTLLSDAYIKATPANVPVYVLNKGDNKFIVYDVRCTHLGCPITWDDKGQKFDCPCHGGVFDIHGKVTGGPPPRPLDRYDTKVENGVLYAGPLQHVSPSEAI